MHVEIAMPLYLLRTYWSNVLQFLFPNVYNILYAQIN